MDAPVEKQLAPEAADDLWQAVGRLLPQKAVLEKLEALCVAELLDVDAVVFQDLDQLGRDARPLAATGVAKEKILVFLKADPEGKGSVQDQVTAEMTSELMQVMGLKGSQKAENVKGIRESIEKEKK